MQQDNQRAETGTWEVPYESEEKLFTVRVM